MSVAETTYQPDGYMDQKVSLADFMAGLNRQRKPIIFTGCAVLILALLVALFWPPTYNATATILIEEQEIPQDMVRSTVTSYATQQIEIIRQRTLTQKNIMDMVEKYGIHSEKDLARTPRAKIAEKFREAVSLELLSTRVVDPSSGRPTEATIAFTLEFRADKPQKALNVTNELVNLFLNENLRVRSAKAASTSDFLRKEADDLRQEVKTLETGISRFKEENQGALPENFQINLQNLARYQAQVIAAESQLQQIQKRIPEIEARLAETSAYAATVLPSGERVLGDVDRLKALQSDHRRKAARYSANHPDLIALNREIDLLASKVGHSGDKNDLLKLVASRKNELLSLRSKYADNHPEVLAQENLIEQLERQVAKLGDSEPDMVPDNPAYILMENQLRSLQIDRVALEGKVTQLNKQIEALNRVAVQAPTVEREYNDLTRNREVATAKYLDLSVKLREAELGGELEEERMAQRFTLIDPPVLPQKPVSPNRLAILFLGAVLAAGASLGLAFSLEAMDQSIRSTRNLSVLMGVAPLVTIPYISTPAEKLANRPQRKLYFILGGGLLLGVIFFTLVHFYYKPLDVLWFVVLRKLGIG